MSSSNNRESRMEALPEAILQYIISHISNARDVANCNCVSKRWKDSTPFISSLYFARNSFDNLTSDPNTIITRLISSIVSLEHLVVYCPFSAEALLTWLSTTNHSLRHLELRLDNLSDKALTDPSKLDCIDTARSLESLKLWGVLITQTPKWGGFSSLQTLEIVGARFTDSALADAIRACPSVTNLSLLGCDGLRSVSIELKRLEQCRLDFYGPGNCSLFLNCPRIRHLEVQGCSWIQAKPNHCLTHLSVSNNAGRVYKVDFGNLASLEELSIRGVQWCWEAVSSILQCASEVKCLTMKIEFTGDYDTLKPFPEIHLATFFNTHPKLVRFEMHGAMFAALSQKNSLACLDSNFVIPCLEEVVLMVRSPLNAEQKMSTLESLLKYGKNLRRMAIRILQMRNHNAADDFFEEVCRYCPSTMIRSVKCGVILASVLFGPGLLLGLMGNKLHTNKNR